MESIEIMILLCVARYDIAYSPLTGEEFDVVPLRGPGHEAETRVQVVVLHGGLDQGFCGGYGKKSKKTKKM